MKRTTHNHANWRSVKRCVPKDGRMVLIFAPSADPESPFIHFGWWDKESKVWLGIVKCWAQAITHWMPLPKAPRK